MPKVVIPKSDLPDLSTDLTNKLRYRVLNRNKNLYSDWSVIGEVKRALEQINFSSASASYNAYSEGNNRVDAFWYSSDINQNFDVYVRYILKTVIEGTFVTLYSYDPIQYLGRKSTNSLTIAKKPMDLVSFNSLSYYGLQLMVKLPEYPIVSNSPISITQARRKSNELQYTLERSHSLSIGDYVNITFKNKTTYGSEADYSLYSGIKQVSSTSPNGVNSFGVSSVGSDTAFIQAQVFEGYPNTNVVEKISGSVLFATGDIIFAS
jgi:hypothetical protein